MTNGEIAELVHDTVLAALHNIARELRRRKIFVDDPQAYPLTLWAMTVYRGVRTAEPRPDHLVVGIHMHEDGDDILFALQIATVGGREVAGEAPAGWVSRNDREGILEQARFYMDPAVIADVVEDILGYFRDPVGPKEWSPRWPKRRKPGMGAVGPKEWSPRWWTAVKVNAGHSTTGNPRRGWVIIDHRSGDMLDFVEEGYRGREALTRTYPEAVMGPELQVTPGQYRDLVRFGEEQAERHRRRET